MKIPELLALLRERSLFTGTLNNSDVQPYVGGTTGTGLDRLVDLITYDPELNRRLSASEIAEAARAADDMNAILLEAVRATGVANDGWVNAADLHDVSAYIRADSGLSARWALLHGDDDGDEESGFHLVQNDGAVSRLLDSNAVNTVADGLYHIGFAVRRGRFLDEDGNSNVSLEQAADWLNDLLAEDLMAGKLANPDIAPYARGSTGTGLDRLVELIAADDGLNQRLSTSEITTAARIDFGGAHQRGSLEEFLGDNASLISGRGGVAMETMGVHLQGYVHIPAGEHRVTVRSDDGFALLLGGEPFSGFETSRSFHATNKVGDFAGGLYEIEVFYYENRGNEGLRLEVDGQTLGGEHFYRSVEDFSEALAAHGPMPAGGLPALDPPPRGSTDTGLDRLVDLILEDPELDRRLERDELHEGARAADALNGLIVEAVRATGVANDGALSASDMHDVNAYLQAHHVAAWTALHGDDEGREETGFHLVQNDGAVTRLYDENAINTVADGLYHMGFEIRHGRFLNEDGNANASVEQVAVWLDDLLEQDLAAVVAGAAATSGPDADEPGYMARPDYSSPYTDALAGAIIAVDDGVIDLEDVLANASIYDDSV